MGESKCYLAKCGVALTHAVVDDLVFLLSPAPVSGGLAHPVLRADRDEVFFALELDLGADVVILLPQKRLRTVLGRLDVLARYD